MDAQLNLSNKVIVTPLKKIHHIKGDVLHALKIKETSFSGFGEAYFTTIHRKEIKGWKKHTKMVMNLIVPVGEVVFYFYDQVESKSMSVRSGIQNNYVRITVYPGVWMAFQGLSEGINLILNIANIEHESSESVNMDINTFPLNKINESI